MPKGKYVRTKKQNKHISEAILKKLKSSRYKKRLINNLGKYAKKGCKLSKERKERMRLLQKGHIVTEKTKKKIRLANTGEKNRSWKGDKAGYKAVHIWVRKRKPKPKFCEICRKEEPNEIANISGKYKRDINDFRWLCHPCHMRIDKRIDIKMTDKYKKFEKELKENRERMTKMLNPKICYTKEYDIFSMYWGKNKIDSTIETNLLGYGDLRFDITKNGTIVGIEIENLTDVLKKFNCDKNERGIKK